MNQTETALMKCKPPAAAVMAVALLCFAAAAGVVLLIALAGLPGEYTVALAYPAVFVTASAGIALVFKLFVQR